MNKNENETVTIDSSRMRFSIFGSSGYEIKNRPVNGKKEKNMR